MSCLSQNFSGLLDANQQVERLKTQQGGPFQLGSTFRLWVLQSLNLPIYREVMAMRIMLGLLQPDPLQSTMMEQFSPLFAFLIFIEVGLLLQLSNLEAHVLKLRVEAERMITGSYFKTFLLNAELILRLFFTAMAATLITKNVLFARDSRSNQFVTSLVDSYRHSLTSESAAFHSLSELKALLRGKLAEA